MEPAPVSPTQDQSLTKALRLSTLLLNCTLLLLGLGGPLLLRTYFLHGGKRMWLSSWLQIGAWPVILIPVSISYVRRRRRLGPENSKLFLMPPPLMASCAALGLLTGLDCYMFTYSSSYLPVSTASILFSTQLAFTSLFAFLIVKQRFTPYSVNAVVILTVGALLLGLRSGNDRPEGESSVHYYLGFFMTIGGSALYGFLLPLMEMVYAKSQQKITYSLVMEATMVLAVFAGGFCLVGMLVNKDFQAIPREAREFGLGEVKYWMLLIWDAILWQIYNLGLVGIILCSSSLLAGVVVAVLLPVTEILAVILFHEKFDEGKGIALALSLWGFASYLYGEHKQNKKVKHSDEVIELYVP